MDIFANLTLTVFAELSRGFPLHPLRCLTNSVGQMLLSQIINPNNKRVADVISSDPHDFSGKDSQVDHRVKKRCSTFEELIMGSSISFNTL